MQPEERDPAYLWDMLEAAREVQRFMAAVRLRPDHLRLLCKPMKLSKIKWSRGHPSSSKSALASWRSAVSKPSVNQP
jgi:hypothetical protein